MPASSAGDPPAAAGPAHADGPPAAASPRPSRFEREHWQRRLRLQRQLHDGASLRISALVPQLGVVRNRVPAAHRDLDASIEGLQDQLHTVLQELREIARAIYPPLLDEAGLGPALRECAERAEVPVRVDVAPGRYGAAVEGAAYFAVADCLAALLPGSPPVLVTARRDGDELVVALSGVPTRLAAGVRDHVGGLGGQVRADGGPDTGTIEARIPCA
ncbi:histidine kinase [Geodermatophilus marinus]|uniref:histidine kinase n=1 Tax=Geodermatophilus sp. LHW52908 TaxID=2303986 RepID=UPI000E3C20EC|nr:histidine kinase [Geodermatophilus sp. LHW52908]RFU22480.1 histidine kinase [Geodermatophilus sp. LHW52908]